MSHPLLSHNGPSSPALQVLQQMALVMKRSRTLPRDPKFEHPKHVCSASAVIALHLRLMAPASFFMSSAPSKMPCCRHSGQAASGGACASTALRLPDALSSPVTSCTSRGCGMWQTDTGDIQPCISHLHLTRGSQRTNSVQYAVRAELVATRQPQWHVHRLLHT